MSKTNEISDGRVILEFLASILHAKGVIGHKEYLSIGDAKNLGDLDRILDDLCGDGQ